VALWFARRGQRSAIRLGPVIGSSDGASDTPSDWASGQFAVWSVVQYCVAVLPVFCVGFIIMTLHCGIVVCTNGASARRLDWGQC
jgi:hypothetical protein